MAFEVDIMHNLMAVQINIKIFGEDAVDHQKQIFLSDFWIW